MAKRPTPAKPDPAPTTPDPIEIAMEAEASGEAPSGAALGLLEDQRRLVRWQIASERAGFTLKVLTGLAGIAAAGLFATMAWQASRAEGVVIEPFSVPPALAVRGVTGQAMARQLEDQLNLLYALSRSGQVQREVLADGGQDASFEIPATGISIDQLEQWLRERLGHQVRVSGEAMLAEDGSLVFVSRLGHAALPVQSGPTAQLSPMLTRTAEAIARREERYAYFQYLRRVGRLDEALAFAREGTRHPDPIWEAKAWVWVGWILQEKVGDTAAAPAFRRAIALRKEPGGYTNLSNYEGQLGHPETALRLRRELVPLLPRSTAPTGVQLHTASRIAFFEGDYARELQNLLALRRDGGIGFSVSVEQLRAWPVEAEIRSHDLLTASDEIAEFAPAIPADDVYRERLRRQLAIAREDWPVAVEAGERLGAVWSSVYRERQAPTSVVEQALALAGANRLADAAALVGATPLDCQACVIVRAKVAEAAGDRLIADHWFGQAVRMAPSLPQAHGAWGVARLARHDLVGAANEAAAAVRLSPRFADGLELWGEALLTQGDLKGAATKFAQAAKLAPRWGRLHLKWGEALAKLGRADEARARWRAAAGMDLSAADRAALKAHGV